MPTIRLNENVRALAASEAESRLRAILDAAIDAIITIDAHGTIESVNQATEQMFGYRAAEMLGRNVKMLMPAEHHDAHDGYLARYLRTGERHIIGVGREIEAQRKDGSVFPADLAVSELQLNGQPMFTGLIRDISDRRDAELAAQARLDELAHAGRLADLGQTTSAIAHEVNQPLTAIVSFAHACQRMLDAGRHDKALLADALAQIALQAERASAIIERVRDLARKGEREPEPVDVNLTVRGVLSMLDRQLRSEHIAVSLDLGIGLCPACVDRVHIEQVVMNLLINAVDALREMPRDGRRIELRTRRVDDAIELSVGDTGPGIGADQVERIFESFYSTKSEGIGMGLSICRQLLGAVGGRMWAEPSPPGSGAVFHVLLPTMQ